MPILWRYLLHSYFRVFLLCVSGFIAVLLVTRFQEIALFSSSGAPLSIIFLFILYQIPHVLPLAIPVSCLIAAILLFQRLSQSHELTAFRTCGLGLTPLVLPMVTLGILLSLGNFAICAAVSPHCRMLSKKLVYEATALNPLSLLQKETMIKFKDAFVDMKVLKSGKYAEDVLLVVRNLSNERLGLMAAKGLSVEGEQLTGTDVSFISSLAPKNGGEFDHLIIENQKGMETKASLITQFLCADSSLTSYASLPLKMIFARMALEKSTADPKLKHSFKHSWGRAEIEISKRLSLSLAPLAFTLLGTAFGMGIGRQERKKRLLGAMGLAALFLICFLSAKSFYHTPLLSCFTYFFPFPIIVLFSLRSMQKIAQGKE